MPIPDIDIRVVYRNDLNERIRRDMLPLVEIGQVAGARIKRRVFERALAADGKPWSDYRIPRSRTWYWVPPGKPQPAAHRLTVVKQSGKDHPVGWAAYPSYRHYKQALGQNRKNFVASGQLRDSMRLRAVDPDTVRIDFPGTKRNDRKVRKVKPKGRRTSLVVSAAGIRVARKALNNAQVAKFAGAKERMSLLSISHAEIREVNRLMEDLLPGRLLKTLALDAKAVRAERKAKSIVRRAKKAKLKLQGARA